MSELAENRSGTYSCPVCGRDYPHSKLEHEEDMKRRDVLMAAHGLVRLFQSYAGCDCTHHADAYLGLRRWLHESADEITQRYSDESAGVEK